MTRQTSSAGLRSPRRPSTDMERRALVVTVVHNPNDARIRHREISALLAAGWAVTYAAPFSGYDLDAEPPVAGLNTVDLPRARGRRRIAALRAARRLLHEQARDHDVVLLHDPELLLALPGLALPPIIWDVHEDTPAAVTLKPWLPKLLRRPVATAVRAVEQLASRRVSLLLAEESYRDRFHGEHLVVPNTVRVPDQITAPSDRLVVYLGHVTLARGAAELIRVGQQVAEATNGDTQLLIIGDADAAARRLLIPAVEAGQVRWTGFVPSDQALAMLPGALAGLALLHDESNYGWSLPTKIIEYMAYGIPVITTPLPEAKRIVQDAGAGVVVGFGDADAVVKEVLRLKADPPLRTAYGSAGHEAAAQRHDWRRQSVAFVNEVSRIAREGAGAQPR
jgi:glycosyltransferase involved in cell wall biosynthesis